MPKAKYDVIYRDLKEKIDIFDLVKIIKSQNGLKKDVNCKYKVIINKVDKKEYLDKCKKIAKLCFKLDIDVIFTSYKI